MFDNSRFFVGIVKDNDDTHRPNVEDQKQGKVQVRILGVHDILNTPDNNEGRGVDDKDLPWCACLMPNIFGGVATQGTVPNPSLQIGAWVFGVSLDETYQNNIVLGIICLPQNMCPSTLGQGGAIGAGGVAGAMGMVNMSSSCVDKHELSLLSCESIGAFGGQGVSFGNISDEVNRRATGNRTNVAGVFQIEKATAEDYYKKAVAQGVLKIEGLSPNQAYQKCRESAEFNVALGKFIAETKMKQAAARTGSGSLMYAAAYYNIGCGNFNKFANYLEGKYGGRSGLKNIEDSKIASEYEYFFGSGPGRWMTENGKTYDISSNRTYLQKYLKFLNGMGGSNCLEEARSGNDLTKVPDGASMTNSELANRSLQELQKMGPMTYNNDLRMKKGYADCSSLMSRILYAQGLISGNSFTTANLGNALISSGNFAVAGTASLSQLNDSYLKPGDVIIWKNNSGGMGHTEMYLGGGKWIAARSSGVGIRTNNGSWNDLAKRKGASSFTVYRKK